MHCRIARWILLSSGYIVEIWWHLTVSREPKQVAIPFLLFFIITQCQKLTKSFHGALKSSTLERTSCLPPPTSLQRLFQKKKNKFTKTDNTTRSSFNFLLLLLLLFFMSTPLFFSPWRVLNSRHIIHKYLFRLLLLGPSFQSKHGRKVAAGSRSHGYFLLCLFSQLSIIVNDQMSKVSPIIILSWRLLQGMLLLCYFMQLPCNVN
jgi:hypothetical protein